MDKLNIEICSCTECVMNGSMDIMEALEQLKETSGEFKENFNTDAEINITPVKCLGEEKHGASSPRVAINGQIFEKADSETIMSVVLEKLTKEVVL